MVLPESALISFRSMVSPAPVVGLYRSARTCCCTEDAAFMTVAAWPKPSEAPKPVIVWKVVPPLIVAVLAASAGPAVATRPAMSVAAVTVIAADRAASLFVVCMSFLWSSQPVVQVPSGRCQRSS